MDQMEIKKKDDWNLAKNYFLLPRINPQKLQEEIRFQAENYHNLSFLKSFRGRLVIVFGLMVNAVFVEYVLSRGLDSFAIFAIIFDLILLLTSLGYRLAMHPLMFVAFIYPIIISASVFPSKGAIADFALFGAIAVGLWLMVEVYKTVQVENLREKNNLTAK